MKIIQQTQDTLHLRQAPSVLDLVLFLVVLFSFVNGFNKGVFGIEAGNPLIIVMGIIACFGIAHQRVHLTQLQLDRASQSITATRWTIFGRKTDQYSMTDRPRADVDEGMPGFMNLFKIGRLGFVGTAVDPIWLGDIGDIRKPHHAAHIINRWLAGRVA